MKAVVFAYSNVGDRCLRVLQAFGVEVALVVTHRDHPGELIWFDRVADTAAEFNIPVCYSDDPTDGAVARLVQEVRPDVIFSFYYRAMIPVGILSIAPLGAFNMHGSLLPKYRGRAPTNWAVLHGETETGATLHAMVSKPDSGYIVDQSAIPILPDDTGRQVFDKVTVAAEQVLWRSLPSIMNGQPVRLPNDLSRGSYFPGRKPDDGRIDWSQPASKVYNLIRAVAPPYPGAFIELSGNRLVIAAARLSPPGLHDLRTLEPGLNVLGGRIVALCGDHAAIDVREIYLGSKPLDAQSLDELLRANIEQKTS
jgi:methionyl-tRNA formyltransferase